MMRRLPLRFAVGLLTFIIGIAAASYWLSSQQVKQQQSQSNPAQATKPSLNGLWLMGNASSGTEANTIIRIVQHDGQVQGIIERPSVEYAKGFGVKNGDVEFEGLLDGSTLRGQVHSYSSVEFQQTCPKAPVVMLKHFEMSINDKGNALEGWTDNNWMNFEQCDTRVDGRASYTFRRIK